MSHKEMMTPEAETGGEEGMNRKENQIFVRNLSYETISEDLIGLFEEFGPIKAATIVMKDGVSRGFGFVKFALDDDADAALNALQGKELRGRKLKLEIAVQRGQSSKGIGSSEEIMKNDQGERNDSRCENSPNVRAQTPLSEGNISLQAVVFGVPPDVNKKVFKEAVIKFVPFKSKKLTVELLKPDHLLYDQVCIDQIYPPGRAMLLSVPSRQDVTKLVSSLDNITAKALGININNAEDDKQSNAKRKFCCRAVKDITPLHVRKQKCRLILRNLSFQASEENIQSKLFKFGPMVEVSIPRVEIDPNSIKNNNADGNKYSRNRLNKKIRDGKPQLKPRGFAFVTFLCEIDSEKAVRESEGLKICNREFAIDFCQHKHGYGFAAEREENEGVVLDEGNGLDEEKNEGGQDDRTLDSDGEEDASDYSGEEVSVDDNESEPGSEMEWNGSESDSEEERDANTESQSKNASCDVSEKKTVFVRDLPFDADQADVKRVFRQFGPIEFAVIVKDKITKNSKGSAFVKFKTQEAALSCVESCERLPGANLANSAGKSHTKNENGVSTSTALSTLTLTVKGRPFRVDLAVDRDEAKKLKEDPGAKSGKDKRNLYLANEGLLVDSAVSLKRYGDAQKSNNDMSDADREKRRRSQKEKKKKLENPLYFVSPTRLSVRNLKKTVDHSELFSICYKAAKNGLQSGLVEKKDMEEYLTAQSVPVRQRTPQLLAIPKLEGVQQNKIIKKAKVMLDSNKLRGVDKTPQSRGYGFVEFSHHAHALACLRELNNNPVYGRKYATQFGAKGEKLHNLIVDFSLENVQKVSVLNNRIEKRNMAKLESSAEDGAPEQEHDELAGSPKKRPREEVEEEEGGGHESPGDEKEKKSASRLEKKLERARKRKLKEERRKENKRQKLNQQLEEPSPATAAATTTNKKASVAGSKAWGGHKRLRAKSKQKK